MKHFLFIFFLCHPLALGAEIILEVTFSPNIILLGDNHEENERSKKQEKKLLSRLAQAEERVVVLVEGDMRLPKNPNVTVKNIDQRDVLKDAINFFDPALLPPFQYDLYAATFQDLFKEIATLKKKDEKIEAVDQLKKILEEHDIAHDDSLLETAMICFLQGLVTVERQEIMCAYKKFLKKLTDLELAQEIERAIFRCKKKCDSVRREISQQLVRIDERIIDVAVFEEILKYEHEYTVIVWMGADHIRSLIKFLDKMPTAQGPGVLRPFGVGLQIVRSPRGLHGT